MAEPGNKFSDIQRYLSDGRFPSTFCPAKKKNLKRYAQKFQLEGGCLYYVGPKKDEKREVVADREKRRQIFLECHFSDIGSHLGQKKTVHRIQSRYYWLGIVKDVVDWIKMCDTCQHAEHYKNMSRKYPPLKVTRPWEILGFDLIGPFPETTCGNTYVLTVTDYFTKWVEAIPIMKKDALSVAKGLATTFYRFGASKDIFSNESRVFCDEGKFEIAHEYRLPETCGIKTESIDEFTDSVTEQQNAVKEMVIANMTAAHKREKKNAKRKARKGIELTAEEEVFPGNSNQTAKKHKKSHFLSFQIETTLSSEHNVNSGLV
ncbi:gypsy retrotransposon integrase-like protein 1 isoform X2 [Cetorhinus maximus]